MQRAGYEFNLRELAGALGDFGTLIPLAVGYITVCGLNPTGLLVMMGIVNIVIGVVYKIPLPLQPMKVIAVVAIAQHWSPDMVYASGVIIGVLLLLLTLSGMIGWIARITPHAVTRGIQVALGILLLVKAWNMLATGWLVGAVALVIVLRLRSSRRAPASIVLIGLGLG
ncbi:MAG: hypothetical protein GY868_16715, partial [Deltaproteobacteria bacterium]|nr:hypothetical protein [Deltaproteobacteria bacterium]